MEIKWDWRRPPSRDQAIRDIRRREIDYRDDHILAYQHLCRLRREAASRARTDQERRRLLAQINAALNECLSENS